MKQLPEQQRPSLRLAHCEDSDPQSSPFASLLYHPSVFLPSMEASSLTISPKKETTRLMAMAMAMRAQTQGQT